MKEQFLASEELIGQCQMTQKELSVLPFYLCDTAQTNLEILSDVS